MPKVKRYLGDGAYVSFDGYDIVLTTEDGYSETNRVVLNWRAVRDFELFIVELNKSIQNAMKEKNNVES